jgi:hypothetical protein
MSNLVQQFDTMAMDVNSMLVTFRSFLIQVDNKLEEQNARIKALEAKNEPKVDSSGEEQ